MSNLGSFSQSFRKVSLTFHEKLVQPVLEYAVEKTIKRLYSISCWQGGILIHIPVLPFTTKSPTKTSAYCSRIRCMGKNCWKSWFGILPLLEHVLVGHFKTVGMYIYIWSFCGCSFWNNVNIKSLLLPINWLLNTR